MARTTTTTQIRAALSELPVFVIAFKEAVDRRAVITERLAPLGLTPTFIDAVDGRAFDEAARTKKLNPARRKFLPRSLSPGAVGCSLSHQNAWQALVTSGADCALILEDDAILSDAAGPILEGLAARAADFDIITLHHYKLRPRHIIELLPEAHELSIVRYNQIGAIAYLISSAAATRLLASSLPMTFEVDLYMNRWWEHGVRNFVVYPPIATEDGRASTIGYIDKQPLWSDDTRTLKLQRRMNRVLDSLQKRLRFSAYLKAARRQWFQPNP